MDLPLVAENFTSCVCVFLACVIFQPWLDLFHLSLIILFSLMYLLHVISMSEVVISSLTFPTFKKMILMKGVNDTWGNQHH